MIVGNAIMHSCIRTRYKISIIFSYLLVHPQDHARQRYADCSIPLDPLELEGVLIREGRMCE